MKEICILTEQLDRFGGQQRIVSTIANSLSKNSNYKITVCALNKNKVYYDLNKKINIDYRYDLSYINRNIIQKVIILLFSKGYIKTNSTRFLKAIYYPNRLVKKLNQYLLEKRFDIVIGVAPAITTLLCLTEYDCKKIGWQHSVFDWDFKKGKRFYGQKALCSQLFKKLYVNIVVNKEDKIKYDEFTNTNSLVIYNTITITSKITQGLNNSTLIFVGRLVKYNKGLDYLVEILEQLYKLNQNYKCFIVGDGSGKDYLIKEIQSRELTNNIKLVGQTQNVVSYYTKSSILLSTSRWESFGLVLTEAMSCGVIPISFENNGSKEIIDNDVNGYIINNFDIKKYVETINDLLHDDKKRKKLSFKAIEKSKEFNINTILGQWNDILNEFN